jgi:citrate/tricarballylate utilization protein
MELRRTFSEQDLKFLANVCHNCRGCYYACQYAPPHEYSVNVPKALGELRLETYREWSWPASLAGLFSRNGLTVTVITAMSVLLVLVLTLAGKGSSVLFGIHMGENAFYRIIPYPALVLTMSALGIFVVAALLKGFANLWRATGGTTSELIDPHANAQALWDALRLKYLDGGGYGCNYPDDRFSMVRPWFHHGVFYGFMFCLSATAVAMIYEHFFHLSAPYPFWSLPVILGTIGGICLLTGTGGLLYLKKRMDRAPAAPEALGMDVAFLVLLFLTSLTGLLLLFLRETSLMGILLVVHVGLVVGLFITMPYGKFIHSVYRYAALVRNAMEQSRGYK